MDPISLLSAAPGVAEGIFKLISGNSQVKQGEQIAKNNPFIPESMPGQVTQATNLAAQNYTNGMPGMNVAQQGIRQNSGNAYAAAAKGASSGGDLIDAANKINVTSQDAQEKLAMQAASYKSNALGGYQEALGNEASWADKLYKNNTLEPYLRAANTAASLIGAGKTNEFGGLDSIAGGVSAGVQSQQNSNFAKKIGANGGAAATDNGYQDWLNLSTMGGNQFTFK